MEPMPIALREQHPEWMCVDFKNGTVVLNNTYSIVEGNEGKGILRMGSAEELQNAENVTWIYMAYTTSWMFYVPAKDADIISHHNLRWYINGIDPPVLIKT